MVQHVPLALISWPRGVRPTKRIDRDPGPGPPVPRSRESNHRGPAAICLIAPQELQERRLQKRNRNQSTTTGERRQMRIAIGFSALALALVAVACSSAEPSVNEAAGQLGAVSPSANPKVLCGVEQPCL